MLKFPMVLRIVGIYKKAKEQLEFNNGNVSLYFGI